MQKKKIYVKGRRESKDQNKGCWNKAYSKINLQKWLPEKINITHSIINNEYWALSK